jgi:putative DNA primase/helicase
MIKEEGKKRMFSLRDDLPRLRRKILDIGNVKLVLIDPVSAYMNCAGASGKIDTFRTSDVRTVLGPVSELAEELDIGVVGIMHFNKKADVTNIVLRVSDSLAFGAAARHVYAAIDDKENDRRLLIRGKNNLAPRNTGGTLAYRFNEKYVGDDPRTKEAIRAPFIEFDSEYVDITAAEAMRAVSDFKDPGTGERARTLLRDMLAGGPVPQKEIEEMAKAEDISISTLRRVKKKVGVRHQKKGKKWMWELIAKGARNPSGGTGSKSTPKGSRA